MTREQLQLSPRPESALHCPYCHSAIDEGETARCEQCETLSHVDCLQIYGGCAVYACSGIERKSHEAEVAESWTPSARFEALFSDGYMFLSASLFALCSWAFIPFNEALLQEETLHVPGHTGFLFKVLGAGAGWGSILVTLVIVLINRLLVLRFPDHREKFNDTLSFVFVVVAPFLIIVSNGLAFWT